MTRALEDFTHVSTASAMRSGSTVGGRVGRVGRAARAVVGGRAFARGALILTAVFIGLAVYVLSVLLTDTTFSWVPGTDYRLYATAAQRWLAGGGYYYPQQLAGPYEIWSGAVMYPPPSLLLFVPLSMAPAITWWAIPISIVGASVIHHRPARWAWPLLAACVAWPLTVQLALAGNPVLWVTAAVALATRWPWMSVLALLKPTDLPFALLGLRTRRWWMALVVCAAVSLVFLPMWIEWVHVIMNARGQRAGIWYSAWDIPMLLIPVLAWAGSRRGARSEDPATAPS